MISFNLVTGLFILSAVVTVSSACYRYVWGSKSHISLSRFSSLDDSEWRDGVSDNKPTWNRRILVRATNNGWRDGVIAGVELENVVVWDCDGSRTVIDDPTSGVHKIELEHFTADGENKRLSIQQRTNYVGQIIPGRDDELLGILPFILQDSALGEAMQEGERGVFTFVVRVEDLKRIYSVSVDVETELTDSAGGKLEEAESS